MTPYMPPATPTYTAQGYPFPSEPTPVQDPSGYPSYAPAEAASWNYPSQASIDRPSQPYEANAAEVGYTNSSSSAETWPVDGPSRSNSEAMPYRTWSHEQHAYPAMENAAVAHGQDVIDPALRAPQMQPTPGQHPSWSPGPIDPYGRYNLVPVPSQISPVPSSAPAHHPSSVETSMYASASYVQQQQEQQHQQQAQSQTTFHNQTYPRESTPPSTIPPLPRHTYTRTLVGPLSANACRLLDEHRKPGIFFRFPDLSVPTEGKCSHGCRILHAYPPMRTFAPPLLFADTVSQGHSACD